MAFYWKYTRSGMYSTTYLSFIIDVLPTYVNRVGGSLFWETSFEELESFLILLQDIEAINNPVANITKPNYANFVTQLGYTATNTYTVQGSNFYIGTAIMGKHTGRPLPWGYVDIKTTPITLDVTGIKCSAFPNASNGLIPNHTDDKLLTFRNHTSFVNTGSYWDYMPLHSCIVMIINEMKKVNANRTDLFVKNILKWV